MAETEVMRTTPQRTFLLVLIGQVVSAFGSGLTSFAVAVWVYQQSQSLLQFGLVMFVNAAATALTAPFLGVACDRYPLRRMMLIGDGGAALLTALMLVLVLNSQLLIWLLLIAVAIDSVLASLHQIAYRSAVPAMVDKQSLARANGMLETGLGLSALLAPLAAGALLGVIGLAGIFIIDLLSFAVALLTLSLARFPNPVADANTAASQSRVWQSMAEGWCYLRQGPGLFALLLIVLAGSFALSGVHVLFTPMVLATHGAATLGLLTTVAGLGSLAAGVMMSIDNRHANAASLILCQGVLALLLIAIGLSNSTPSSSAPSSSALWLGLLVFASFGASQWGSIVARTLWQREVDPAMRGRVFSFVSASSALVIPVSTIGAPWIAESVVQPWLSGGSDAAELIAGSFGSGNAAAAALGIAVIGVGLLAFVLLAQIHPAWRALRNPPEPLVESP